VSCKEAPELIFLACCFHLKAVDLANRTGGSTNPMHERHLCRYIVCVCTTEYTIFALKLAPGSDLQTVNKQMVGHISAGYILM
jgi:hypothetical protein